MLNQAILVGRINGELKEEMVGERKVVKLNLVVQRSYKNSEGVYETDMIPVVLWDGIAQNVAEYCKKGDLVGVKGRLQSDNNGLEVICEKVTFLSGKANLSGEAQD